MTVSASASDRSSVCGSDDSDSGAGAGGCADCSATTFVSRISAGSDVSGSGAAIARSMNDANHMTKARFRVGIQSFGNGRNKATKDNVPVTTLINTNRSATCTTSTRSRNHGRDCAFGCGKRAQICPQSGGHIPVPSACARSRNGSLRLLVQKIHEIVVGIRQSVHVSVEEMLLLC